MTEKKNAFLIPFAIVTALFFTWGFITVFVDALIPRLRAVFELTYFQAGLVQVAFFGAYFVVSLPSGAILSRIGYKRGIVAGLTAMAIGCFLFIPAASIRVYPLFLGALFVLAGGMTMLQVAANPYVVALGPERTGASRLNLSQAFNSLGTAIAPLFAAALILGSEVLGSDAQAALGEAERMAYLATEAEAVRLPFGMIGLALIGLALFFVFVHLPKIQEPESPDSGSKAWKFVLTHRGLMLGALGIFLYVGAEVTIGSYIVNYFLSFDVPDLVRESAAITGLIEHISGKPISELNPSRIAGTFVMFYWSGAMIGRFIGAGLSRVIAPGRMLAGYALISVLLCVTTALSGGFVAVWAVLAIGLWNSIMFPTIFSLAINSLPHNRSQGSGILCAAIVGGAVLPPLFGLLSDVTGFAAAFIVPVLAYTYIAFYGWSRKA